MRYASTAVASSLLLFATSITAQGTTHNLTSTGCYDVVAYTTCSGTAAGKAQVCQAAAVGADSQLALAACGCVYHIEMMNCFMASCWNRVYECEYQEYAIQYISECPSGLAVTDIPFFPPPENAPGSCSCNLGKLYLAVNGSQSEGASCISNVAIDALANLNTDLITTENMEEACACCGESGAISAFYNICPNTLPSVVGINEVYSYIADLGQPFSNCAPYMSAYDCTTELNFTNVSDGTFYTPDNLPANGTASLSNIAGILSAPPSGTLFSYTNYFDSTVYTITAAVEGNESVIGGVTDTTVGGNDGVTETGTGQKPTSQKPTSTLKSGAASAGSDWNWRDAAIVVSVGFFILQ